MSNYTIRIALRRLSTAPAFTFFAVATLALGIGATSAIYSVIHAAVLRPPDFADVGRVVNLYHANAPALGGMSGQLSAFSSADFDDLRRTATSFSGVAPWSMFRQTVVANGAEVTSGEMVGGDFFEVLGVPAALGRTIQPQDDRPGATPVVVLSDGFWQRRFGRDPSVIGRTIRIKGHPFEVVGIAAPIFRGVYVPALMPTPMWIPLSAAPLVMDQPRDPADREARWLWVRARLAQGRTVEQAQAEVAAIARQLDAAHPIGRDIPAQFRIPPYFRRDWTVIRSADIYSHESVHRVAVPVVWTVMGVIGLVLLIACTNLANLLLARGAARRQEFAVRLALGASRARLIRELLVESSLIASAGAGGALLIAQWLITTVLSQPIHLSMGSTMQATPRLEPAVLAAAAGATLLSLIVFGLIPALHVTRADLRDALATDNAGAAVPRWRGRRHLIATQVAVSVGLVAIAALCIQQTMAMAGRPLSIDVRRLASVTLDFGMQGEPEPQARETLDRVADSSRTEPGVQAVALASALPFGQSGRHAWIATDLMALSSERQSPLRRTVKFVVASPELISTLQLRLSRGRAFDARDAAGGLQVALLSEAAARAVFDTADAVGRQLLVRRQASAGDTGPVVVPRTIVGVVPDVSAVTDPRQSSGVVYVPFSQQYESRMLVVARATDDAAGLAGRLESVVRKTDPDLAVADKTAGVALTGVNDLPLKIGATMAGLLGLLALVLSMAGLYGVLAHLVTRRTREIGLRLALGAERADIVRMVVRDGLRPVLEGLVLGFGFAALLRMAMRPLFVRLMPSMNWELLLLVPVPFVAAALLAAYLPARRAARVDPNVALRHL